MNDETVPDGIPPAGPLEELERPPTLANLLVTPKAERADLLKLTAAFSHFFPLFSLPGLLSLPSPGNPRRAAVKHAVQMVESNI